MGQHFSSPGLDGSIINLSQYLSQYSAATSVYNYANPFKNAYFDYVTTQLQTISSAIVNDYTSPSDYTDEVQASVDQFSSLLVTLLQSYVDDSEVQTQPYAAGYVLDISNTIYVNVNAFYSAYYSRILQSCSFVPALSSDVSAANSAFSEVENLQLGGGSLNDPIRTRAMPSIASTSCSASTCPPAVSSIVLLGSTIQCYVNVPCATSSSPSITIVETPPP